MEICRICLASNAKRHISEFVVDDQNIQDFDVMSFCLGIKISEDSKPNTKFCLKCFKKINEFYQFKRLAIKNNSYFKTYNHVPIIKLEKMDLYDDQVMVNLIDSDSELMVKNENFDEDKLENGNQFHDDFDDSVLMSALKDIVKKESIQEDITEIVADPQKTKVKYKKKKVSAKSRVCDECGKSVIDLRQHMNTHKKSSEKKTYPCKICNRIFGNQRARRRHIEVKHEGIRKHCDQCGKDVVCLWSHVRNVHMKVNKPFACNVCDKRFLSRGILAEHILRHETDKPFGCEQCKNKFSSTLTLKNHIKQVHNKEKSHCCEFCSKTFFKKENLLVHIRSHTKEKPYPCKDCGKAFPTPYALKIHSTVHTGIKNYKCKYCDMSFSRHSNLFKHNVIHTKQKNYACKYCGVSFYRSDHRKRHEFTAHEKINALVSYEDKNILIK